MLVVVGGQDAGFLSETSIAPLSKQKPCSEGGHKLTNRCNTASNLFKCDRGVEI